MHHNWRHECTHAHAPHRVRAHAAHVCAYLCLDVLHKPCGLVQPPHQISNSIPHVSLLLIRGRAPRTKGLGLQELGVELGKKGEVVVDEYSRSSIPSSWALGDVIAK